MHSINCYLLLVILICTINANLSHDDSKADFDRIVEVETFPPGDVIYVTPDIHPGSYFSEHFDSKEMFNNKWFKSLAKKDAADVEISKYDGEWAQEKQNKDPLSGDFSLVLKTKAKHAAISAKLTKPFVFRNKQFIVQYELNFQNGQDCGGGYIKLLSHKENMDLFQFTDKTPYSIMFGPDKCGSDAKLHFIFRHKNPNNNTFEEKHCKKLETKERSMFEEFFKDKRPHLYRLTIRPDNTYDILVDYKIFKSGSLLEDFTPPVNPPEEIDDPTDKKPENWDDREKIPDPTASKPDDWDEDEPRTVIDTTAVMPGGWLENEPEMIPDSTAERPEDWDDNMDGEWEAPLVANPSCANAPGCGKWKHPIINNPLHKGKWYPPLINNPSYKGKWNPKKIKNPDYFYDAEPYKMTSIGAVGIELWSMSSDIAFDNLIITDDIKVADKWASDTFDLKIQKLNVNDASMFRRILNYSNRNPWLYAVYVVVIGLPLVLIITFCCSGDNNGTDMDSKNKLNNFKKTDEFQDDDNEREDEEKDLEEDEVNDGDDKIDEEPLMQTRNSTRKRRAKRD